jgi:hypothetical protein
MAPKNPQKGPNFEALALVVLNVLQEQQIQNENPWIEPLMGSAAR